MRQFLLPVSVSKKNHACQNLYELKEEYGDIFVLDLFKSLVVLWIVNTVNKLIHLHHIIHQNNQSILYEL